MDIGKIIKDARLQKGLTQEELGELVGVQKSAIAKYENGRVVNIKRSNLQKLAKALDLKPSDLIIESDWNEKIKKDPETTGAKAAAMLLNQEFVELYHMYEALNAEKKKQVKDFIYFISNKA